MHSDERAQKLQLEHDIHQISFADLMDVMLKLQLLCSLIAVTEARFIAFKEHIWL